MKPWISVIITLTLALPASAESGLMLALSAEKSLVTVRGQTYRESEGRLSMHENTGAGVIIDKTGYIVTNTHIIYGSNVIRIVLTDKTEVSAQIALISQEYDFSILKIDPPQALTAITWPTLNNITLGDNIMTIGHSTLLHHTISGGRISGLGTRTMSNGSVTPELIQLNINHYNGDSGGPVFNQTGEFVGLISAKRTTLQRAALAIPAGKIYSAFATLLPPISNP